MAWRLIIALGGALLASACKPAAVPEQSKSSEPSSATLVKPAETPKLSLSGRKVIRICVDEAEAFPFSYRDHDQVRGVHVDIATAAINAAGFDAEFKFMPWRRCVEHEMFTGSSDTTLSAAWSVEREHYMWYPGDAKDLGPQCSSPSALICNGPVLLVPAGRPFHFAGDYGEIPQPVRITFGYAQVKEFRDKGLNVDEGPGDASNVGKMIRDGTGSVLIWKLSLDNIALDERTKGRYRLVDGFAELSDGFLPFSMKGNVTKAEAEAIWKALAKLRSDPAFQRNIVAKYNGPTPPASSMSQNRQ